MNADCRHRGRPKAIIESDLRRLIAKEAVHLFIQKGYSATTTEEIAVCCKISKQTLYRLFPSKAALFAAVVELKRPQFICFPVPEGLSLQTALEAIFRIDISEDEERERIQLMEMLMAEVRLHPELEDILKDYGSAQGHMALAEWIRHQADKNLIKLAGNAVDMAHLLVDMVFGALIRRTFNDVEWRSGEAWRAHVRTAIQIFLHGVACTSAR